MDTRCHFAFNGLNIYDTNGSFQPCCLTKFRIDQTINGDIQQVINNPQIVELRRSMLRGEKHPACNVCWEIEKYDGKSQRELGNYYSFIHKSPTNFSEYIEPKDLRYMDLFLGNTCNLGCRMCGPHSSSILNQQEKIIVKSDRIPNKFIDETVGNNILKLIDECQGLQMIHLYGGEPLVIDFHDILCEHLIKNGRAKDITLMLSTNLQVDLKKKLDLHQHFKSLRISVSIDGSYDTYEYIRWPGKYEKVKQNLIELLSLQKENPNFLDLACTHVVQNLNIDNLHNFIVELQDIGISNENIYYVEVRDKNLTHILPGHIIDKSIEQLQTLPINPGLMAMLNAALQRSQSVNDQEILKFLDRQYQYDNIRKQNLFETKPHFIELANRVNVKPW